MTRPAQPTGVAVSFLGALVATLLGALTESLWVWGTAAGAMTVAERLILVANSAAVIGLFALPVVVGFEGIAALQRKEGVPWKWLGALRARIGEDDGVAVTTGAGILAMVSAGAATAALMRPLHRVVHGFKDPELATTAGSLLGVGSIAVLLLLWLPAFSALRLLARRMLGSRSEPVRRGAWFFRPIGVVVLLLVPTVVGLVGGAVLYEDVYRSLEPGRWLVGALPGVVYLGIRLFGPHWAPASRLASRMRWYGALAALLAVVTTAITFTVTMADYSQRLRAVRERYAPLGGKALGWLARAFDADRDGHPRVIGSDCNDADPTIHAGALDVPGDGIDQDCFGGDQDPAVAEALVGAVAHVYTPRPTELAHIRNVVLITVDALRADRLGAYGYTAHPTSPALDRLAAEATVFERAYAPAPQTRRSVQPMLTGLYARSVLWGVRHPHTEVLLDNVNIAEMLKPRGIYVGAFYGGIYMARTTGYFQGFDLWDRARAIGRAAAKESVPSTGEDLSDLAIRVLGEKAARRERFFAWVHYTEPHSPYRIHAAFRHFGSSPHDRYCAEIAKSDREIGRLIDAIRSGPEAGSTAILVSSDHGEAFGEHGENFHFRNLYEEEVRVPLIIFVPGLPPRRVGGVVSLVDLVPTVLRLMDVPPPERLHGIDLVPVLLGAPPPEGRVVLMDAAERAFSAANKSGIYRDGHKLIVNAETGTFEMYDVVADPAERTNIFDDKQALAAELRGILAAFRAVTEDSRNSTELVRFVPRAKRKKRKKKKKPK